MAQKTNKQTNNNKTHKNGDKCKAFEKEKTKDCLSTE